MIDKTETLSLRKYRIPALLAAAVAGVLLVLTWVGIRESRADSYQLLVAQGTAFAEALAQASENAISAESFYDYFVQKRYTDLVVSLTEAKLSTLNEQDFKSFLQAHDLLGIYVFDTSLQLSVAAVTHGSGRRPPAFVMEEAGQMMNDPEAGFVLLTDEDDKQIRTVHYYLEKTPQLDHVIVLAADAGRYEEALRQTGIGYLAQNMAKESGVEYIVYQSTDGIIFASRRVQTMLSIESDPFLSHMLDSDTIASRQLEFQGKTVLELVRPFSSKRFPFGLFRVGLSLDRYYAVSRRLTMQMALVALVLLLVVLMLMLYLNGRQKRRELRSRYDTMKSVTDRIFEQMRTGVAVIDENGTVRMANDAFERILGIRQCKGRAWKELVPHERLTSGRMRSSTNGTDELELNITVNGRDKWLLAAYSHISVEPDGRSSIVMVIYDITRLKEFEQISARKERLSEMGNLAAGVAHEIRNPLNTISVAAQRLQVEFEPRENAEEYASFTRKIHQETRRLNDIITRFLALTRARTYDSSLVRLDGLFDEIGPLLKVEAEQHGIHLDFEIQPDIAVRADRGRLTDVFQNLFNNARQALEGREGRILIAATRKGNKIEITFSDNGPGIPVELRQRVFTPYYTTRHEGTGIGLSTVHQIVTENEGDIHIGESEWGGASIVIALPIAKQSE